MKNSRNLEIYSENLFRNVTVYPNFEISSKEFSSEGPLASLCNLNYGYHHKVAAREKPDTSLAYPRTLSLALLDRFIFFFVFGSAKKRKRLTQIQKRNAVPRITAPRANVALLESRQP